MLDCIFYFCLTDAREISGRQNCSIWSPLFFKTSSHKKWKHSNMGWHVAKSVQTTWWKDDTAAVPMSVLLNQVVLLFKTKTATLSMLSSYLNSGYIWFQIKSHTKRFFSQKRDYTILKPGRWTHVVNQGIWKQVKSTWTFLNEPTWIPQHYLVS